MSKILLLLTRRNYLLSGRELYLLAFICLSWLTIHSLQHLRRLGHMNYINSISCSLLSHWFSECWILQRGSRLRVKWNYFFPWHPPCLVAWVSCIFQLTTMNSVSDALNLLSSYVSVTTHYPSLRMRGGNTTSVTRSGSCTTYYSSLHLAHIFENSFYLLDYPQIFKFIVPSVTDTRMFAYLLCDSHQLI